MNVLFLSVFFALGQPPEANLTGEMPLAPEVQPEYAGCDTCPSYCGPRCALRSGVKSLCQAGWDWFGPMPQTCYQPRFGCYPGNSRDIHRYPAFHGYYYRQPYNYRHYFEYPWHADPHEPLGYFSYPQVGESVPEEAAPIEAPYVPQAMSTGKTPHTSVQQNFPSTPRPLPIGTLSSPWQPIKKPTPIRN